MIRPLILALLMLSAAHTAAAKGGDGVVSHKSAPAVLDPGKAYLLFRSSAAKSGMMNIEHVFLRIPTDAEIGTWKAARQAAYDADLPKLQKKAKGGPVPTIGEYSFDYAGPGNVFAIDAGDFIEDGEMRQFLVEVPAGNYVLYGISVGGRGVSTCNCLGTVRFGAAAGTITQLGSLYADKVHKESPIPNLEDSVGPSMFNYGFILGQALLPPDDNTPIPATLASLPRQQAEFSAVGLFREPGAPSINRLAPIPGILGYDRGKVIDLRTGQPAK